MSTVGTSIDALERFTTVVNRLFVLVASVLVIGIMLVTVREVFVRYALNQPSLWAMDGSRYALLYAFFLALGPALQSGHHVNVDLFDSDISCAPASLSDAGRPISCRGVWRGIVPLRLRRDH